MRKPARGRPATTGTPSDALLLALRRRKQNIEHERAVEKALRESGGSADSGKKGATAGGDTEKLRGIPALGPGVGGTQKGTQPEREVVRRDEQRRRVRERIDTD